MNWGEAINDMKPVDVFNGKSKEIETERMCIKRETLSFRKLQKLNYLY